MFQFIRSSSFTSQLMIPVLGTLLFAVVWFLPASLTPGNELGSGYYFLPVDGWLYLFWQNLAALPFAFQLAPTLILLLVSLWILVFQDSHNHLMARRSYGIGYIFLLVMVSSGHLFVVHPAFLSGLIMLVGTGYLLALFKKETNYELVFGFSFAWGVAILLYPPALLIAPVVFIGLIIMVSPTWRHFTAAILGLMLPALVCMGVFYLIGNLDYQIYSFGSWFRFRTTWPPQFLTREPFIAVWFGMMLTWIIVASIRYRNPKVLSRQFFMVNFFHFFLALSMLLLLETPSVEAFWLMVFPITYLLTFWALEVRRNWVRDLFFFTLLSSFVFFRIRDLI